MSTQPSGTRAAWDVSGKPVVVVGLARSGIAAAEFLARRGARVLASDCKPAAELPEQVLKLREMGIEIEAGGHNEGRLRAAALVVVSPGVPWELPQLEAARRAGVPVVAEIELAYRYLNGTIAAVTGTKGKSTTTAALGAMLKEAGRDARVGGNIGAPLVGLLEGSTPQTVFAVEVSSFQLEGIARFHPSLSLFLNLSTDHLDRHPTFEAYAAAKGRVFENQTADDWAVVNADDPGVLALAERGRARRMLFRPAGERPGSGHAAWFEDGAARMSLDGPAERLFNTAEVRLPGAHLAGDLLAAAAAARLLGAPGEAIAQAVRGFRGVEHVLEHVEDIAGVAFYNDSKATNIDAAQRSLESFQRPVLAILGGRYKGGDFADLRPAVKRGVKAILAIGEAQERVRAALAAQTRVIPCSSMREAVETALSEAAPGDVVLLAPACSSFDMFRDYVERGRSFKSEVRRLLAQRARGEGEGG